MSSCSSKFQGSGKESKETLEYSIPYWDPELTELLKNLKTKEHTYTRSKFNYGNRRNLFEEYKVARHVFDK